MNILILNWRDVGHPFSGGAEIVTMEHAKRWVEKGHSVTWFTSFYPGAKREEVVNGVQIIRRSGSLTVYPAGMLYVLLHSHEFDVIVDEVHGFPFFTPLLTKTCVVAFIHEIADEIWDFMYPFPINIIGKFIEKHYFRFYKNCFFWTDAPSTVEELVERGIPRKQCVAIPCPISSIDRLRISDNGLEKKIRNSQSAIKQLVNKEKHPTYIFVSRVVKMKGIEEVIKAFSFIIREQKNAKLWIVGIGDEKYIDELKRMISEYKVQKHIRFWGKVSEQKKYELMAHSHLLLHASVKEGWGLVVLEAASVGTPSVVYDVPGLRDVVKNQKTGIVLKTNSPQEMVRQAVLLLHDKERYQKYQNAGSIWVKSLSWKVVTEESFLLLKKSISSSKK